MNLKEFSKLIRFSNLLIIFLTQFLIWFCVVRTVALWTDTPVFLNFSNTLLLILSTILIAAGGYIINDYFDVKIDAINRPEKSLIGKDINTRWAIILHTACNVLGIGLALLLSYRLHNFYAIIIQLITTILLWLYSTHFKRQYIIGNVTVALLTALSILIFMVYEPSLFTLLFKQKYKVHSGELLANPAWVLLIYTFFAFMLTWMREIVKDMEDFKGDAEDGCLTMPIKIGLKKTTRFVQILGILTIIPLCYVTIKLSQSFWKTQGLYIFITIIIPLILLIINITKSTTQTHYATYSKWLKIIMVLGIFTLIIFYFF